MKSEMEVKVEVLTKENTFLVQQRKTMKAEM